MIRDPVICIHGMLKWWTRESGVR